MAERRALARIKDSNPEVFVFVLADFSSGQILRHMSVPTSEAKVRQTLKDEGRTQTEIEEIINLARKHEV